MGRRIDQLAPGSVDEAANDGFLWAYAPPIAGEAKKLTTAQVKEIFSSWTYQYTGTGSEGDTLTITDLAGKEILMMYRENSVLFEVDSSPGTAEYTWDGTDIVFGSDIEADERIRILYKKL